MSLGLFAAAVVLLEQHGALSVDRMSNLLGVPVEAVLGVLRDMRQQGHCTLTPSGDTVRATWTPLPTEAE